MLTMQDLLNKVPDFSQVKLSDIREVDLMSLEEQLHTGTCAGWSAEVNERLCAVALRAWICTDTEACPENRRIGSFALFFDEKFVGLSLQSARKSDCDYFWVSQEAALSVQRFLRETLNPDEDFHIIDPNLLIRNQFL